MLNATQKKIKVSETTHLKLSDELREAIKSIAENEGRTIANTIRRLLSEAIERRRQ